tara:strand:- start:2249 stop:3031 length:783 start_codon:yes stop_codon:yes gene_type:complete
MNIFNKKTVAILVGTVSGLIVSIILIGMQVNSKFNYFNSQLRTLSTEIRTLDSFMFEAEKQNTSTSNELVDEFYTQAALNLSTHDHIKTEIKNKDLELSNKLKDIENIIVGIRNNFFELQTVTKTNLKNHEHLEFVSREEYNLNNIKTTDETIELPAIVVEEIITEEPVILATTTAVVSSCPKLDPSVKFVNYIKGVYLSKSTKFIVTFDIVEGNITNERYSKRIFTRLKTAVSNYLNAAVSVDDNFTKLECSIPFTINI